MTERTLPFFDEDPSEPEPSVDPGTRGRPLSVSEANTLARDLLEDAFPDVWIQGEISNFKAHGSGHHYFSLKDTRCQMSAVMFRGANVSLRFRPADGLAVLARGRLTIYEARGSYQINVQWMEPLGAGSLQVAFEQLKARLRAEGLFDEARRRPLPALPRRIAVVTSPTGAALRDILRVLERRYAGLEVLISPCRVQGEGAAVEIVEAIRRVNEHSARGGPSRVDVIIVGRGGGSLEDLWAFNEESVARAIAGSAVPVISAVGHEVDFTIADFVADLRAPTPSAAAEMVVKNREDLLARVRSESERLAQAARYLVLSRRSRVDALAGSRAFARVEASLTGAQQRCDESHMRLGNALLSRLQILGERVRIGTERISPRGLLAGLAARRQRLSTAADLLDRAAAGRLRALREATASLHTVLRSLSPLAVLDRGYAIVHHAATGSVIMNAATVSPGDAILVRLARGRLEADVTRREADEGAK